LAKPSGLRSKRFLLATSIGTSLFISPPLRGAQEGASLYEAGCVRCHGSDGRGASSSRIAFDDPLPDFSDCSFASREPDADWIIVSKAGGPIRGFSEVMPAFGEAFDDEQLQSVIDHIRTFCTSASWPRGELNLPRALFTEKAYPEDEAVWTTTVNAEGPGAVINEFVYEKRFGARSQIEIKVPFGFAESVSPRSAGGDPTVEPDSDWGAVLGDLSIGLKQTLAHNDRSILTVATELTFPTGGVDRGLGADAFRIEPFVAFGQILPGDSFLHFQGGVELSTDREALDHEAFWRAAFGRTFTSGELGRAWSPMIEVLGSVDLQDGSRVTWDIVPQMQVTLNTRQHVMLNVGVRLPLTDADQRHTQLLVYLLWDWFDGGLLDGW